jgi:sporulation protein YlmC with PRC-barrel domain
MTKDIKNNRSHEAGVGPDPRQARHLTPLSELKHFRVAQGDPDIRGWTVYTSNGRDIGVVDDLLVDTTRGEVVMLDIDLKGTNRCTLAPIRAAWVDSEHKRVILDGAQLGKDDELPTLGRAAFTDDDARRFGERYESTYGGRGWDRDQEYRIRRSNEEMRLHRRPLAAPSAIADAAGGSPAPGAEVVVERRVVSAEEPSWAEASVDQSGAMQEVRLPPGAQDASGRQPVLVEEVVVRRRVMDADELAAAEEERTTHALPEAQHRDEGA